MKLLLIVGGIAVGWLLVTNAMAEIADKRPEIVTIQLKEIWAYSMPGTRRVGELDAVKQDGVTKHPLVNEIVRSLALKRPKRAESIGPAYIVPGKGKEALRNAHATIANAVEPSIKFSSANDLTLVFYTSLGGPYTHIDSVERSGRTIAIKYRLLSHNTREDTLHFALIPLGKLRSGNYQVRIEPLGLFDETGARKEPSDKSKSIVCSDTTFDVTEVKP